MRGKYAEEREGTEISPFGLADTPCLLKMMTNARKPLPGNFCATLALRRDTGYRNIKA
jgi:hypothetical protein